MMALPATINRYLAKLYTRNLLIMTGILWCIIYLFDTVELLRRAGKTDGVPLSGILAMALMKLPGTGITIIPFAVLFSAIFTLWKLNRCHELVIARAIGLSVWQFLTPLIGVALVTGIIITTAINPVSALLMGRFKSMESFYIDKNKSEIALFDEGLWLRQLYDQGYVILHADRVKMPEWQLHNAIAFYFSNENEFQRRIDADLVTLDNGMWLFKNAILNQPGKKTEKADLVALPTELTGQEIEKSFASPQTMSFWKLPSFIKTVESTGFDATRLKVHFQSLMAIPLLLLAMILLAAAVCLRPPRSGGTFTVIFAGILTGFTAFFMANFLQALGASQQIPAFLSAWAAPFILFLLGLSALLNLEDG